MNICRYNTHKHTHTHTYIYMYTRMLGETVAACSLPLPLHAAGIKKNPD